MKTMGLILTCMIVLLFGGCSEESGDAQLLIYRDVNGHEYRVKTVVGWRKRRDQILDGMQLAMGLLPDRSKLPALDVQITETFNGDGFTRLKLSFVAECNDRVPAYLFLPKHKNGRRSPAMFALHQTTEIGKYILHRVDLIQRYQPIQHYIS